MLLVDAQPPVVRATILVLSACGSLWFGRERLGMNVLAGAGLIVLALNPADLFRIGPQLSFLCVAGIMWLAPMWASLHAGGDPIQRLLGSQRLWPTKVLWLCGRSLRHLTLVSGTIWLLTLPLVMARFHLCSPVAVLLNTLVWIPMAMALVFGFGLLVLGGLPPAAWLCATLCQWNLDLLTWLVERGQKVPLGHHWVPGPADWWLAGFYGALGLWLAFPRLRPPLRWQVALLAGWSALGLAGCWPAPDAHSLRCTLLAVGHGEAVVVELPTGRTLLYDAGRFSSPHGAAQSTAGFLWSRGITHLDAVVLSHGDVDHYNGLPGLLDQFSVGVVYVSPVMQAEMDASREGAGLRVLRDAIRAAGVPLRQIWAGDRLAAGPDCTIDVLHPPRRGIEGSNNANCICLAIEYFGRRVLLTGDLEPPGLGAVLADPPTHYDVLLVPHHGSRQSDPERLAAWSTPDWSVISADRRWDLSRVKEIYRRGGGRVLHTAQTGAVSAVLDCQGARVETFLPPRKTPPMWE
jgi:competence protein ComEC